MPWTVSDVDKHKKGLSSSDKKKWVSIANAVLKDCLAKGGTDATCAPKAIRIANSKFSEVIMKKETIKLNKGAMCFSSGAVAIEQLSDKEPDKKKLAMTAYSGKIIPNHWYWGDLAIDVSGMEISQKAIPILHDHMTSEKIGYGTFKKTDVHEIVSDETTFVETPFAEEFIKLSGQGFPYQASVSAKPTKIQKLEEGEETEVNGFTMKGPGTVWRKSVLRECSVTTFGADGNTKSVAMSENEDIEVEVETNIKKIDKEESCMKLDEFKAAHPELFAEVIALGKAEGKTEAETAFAVIKTGLEGEITALKADKQSLTDQLSGTNDRILKLEKAESLRKEEGIKASANVVFAEVMAAHDIPARLHSKIRKQINHESFVADEKLDETAFKAAVETELKDWMPKEGEDDSSILGMSFGKRDGASGNEDVMVTRMLGHAGVTITKQ